MKNIGVVCLGLLFLLGGLLEENLAHGAENGAHTKEFPIDFECMKTVLQQPNTLSTLMPEWLDLGVEHRTRYETFNQSFTKGTAGSDQMVGQRTRIFFGNKGYLGPYPIHT